MKGLPKSIIKKYGISKKAWRVFRGRKKSSSRSRKLTGKVKKRRTRSMARRKRRGGSRGFTIQTLFKYIRLGSVVAPGIGRYAEIRGSPLFKAEGAIKSYAGIRTDNIFDAGLLMRMWTPLLATTLLTYGIPKIAGILRKL